MVNTARWTSGWKFCCYTDPLISVMLESNNSSNLPPMLLTRSPHRHGSPVDVPAKQWCQKALKPSAASRVHNSHPLVLRHHQICFDYPIGWWNSAQNSKFCVVQHLRVLLNTQDLPNNLKFRLHAPELTSRPMAGKVTQSEPQIAIWFAGMTPPPAPPLTQSPRQGTSHLAECHLVILLNASIRW